MVKQPTGNPLPDMGPSDHAVAPHGSTLAGLLALVGPQVLHATCTPRGVEGDVSEPVIHDVGERVPEQPDGILLAVGGSPARADTLDAIRQAGAARYRAVIIKARGEDYSAAVYEANAAGVCLLIAPDEVPWRYLDTLVTSALGASAWAASPAYDSIPTGDLFELANAIACSVGGATTIEDPRGRVLAHSSLPHQETDEARRLSILHRQPPYRPGGSAAYDRVRQSRGAVRQGSQEPGHWDRLAIAIRAGGAVLGLLWVLDGDPPLDEESEAALEKAARVAALHLVRARGVHRSHQGSRRVALTALLEGRLSEKVAGEQLGLGPDVPTAVLAIGQSADAYIRGLDSERVVDLVGVYCEALHPQAMCAASGETVYAIVPTHEGGGPAPARLARFAEDVAHAVHRTTSVPVHVGIAGPAPRLGDVPACRRTADLVLDALAPNVDRTEVATVEGVHSRVVLLELLERGAAAIVLPADPVQEILAYDQRHTTTYGESLLVYLDAFGEASKAAAALSIHENTLRYRIRRIQELFGLDLSDAETRLVTWLRLHLRQISK